MKLIVTFIRFFSDISASYSRMFVNMLELLQHVFPIKVSKMIRQRWFYSDVFKTIMFFVIPHKKINVDIKLSSILAQYIYYNKKKKY